MRCRATGFVLPHCPSTDESAVTSPLHIHYVELPAEDLGAIKAFYGAAFGWTFVDYGPSYVAIENAGLDGGFYVSEARSTTATGGALVILYAADLEGAEARVKAAGGEIVRPTFSFPGGRRFHFADPHGNELAVWSDGAPASEG